MLESFLFKIPDHRRKQGRRYPLGYILLFSIFAMLAGATSYRKIHAFIKAKYRTLDETFALSWKRLPAYTTIRDIIQSTSSAELEERFRQYSATLAQHKGKRRVVTFDGKVLRGSFDHFQDQKAIHILSAFAPDSQIILAHEDIPEKANEIPTAQDLILKLGLSGCLFTLDAFHCQEKTLKAAAETQNDVIVQVKGNQKTLLKDCRVTAATRTPEEAYEEPLTKVRNRIERRKVEVFPTPEFSDSQKWALVNAIVKVTRHREIFDTRTKSWKTRDEISFYVSTIVLSAKDFCEAIRSHWGIENSNHYVKDVTMGEDRSRIRTNPHLFAKLRSFALNIIRANKVQNVSLELFNNCMNLENILNYGGIK
jgi:predicted transposase YbfD/YdcC